MRLVLVALNALPAIDPQVPGPIGGIETRSWLLAQRLARCDGLHVQFVVRHSRPLMRNRFSGVDLVPLVDRLYPLWQNVGHALQRRDRFPWVRVRQWSPRLLWQLPLLALDRLVRGRVYAADQPDRRLTQLAPDAYLTFGVQTHSAVVIRSAQAAGRPAVLLLGSDGDLDPLFEPDGRGVDPYGTRADVGRFILSAADRIIVQTPEQQRRLSEVFGRSSTLLRSPIDVAAWDAGRNAPLDPQSTAGLDRYILWVGRAEDQHKRPQLCLDVARLCPEATFLMVLNPRDPAVEARIRATAPPNVHIVPRVSPHAMPALFARAAAFVSTSQLEGFPNVFLQAALSGTPIASLAVGSDFLTASAAGVCVQSNLERLADILNAVWRGTMPDGYDRVRARAYVETHHALDTQVRILLSDLQALITSGERPA